MFELALSWLSMFCKLKVHVFSASPILKIRLEPGCNKFRWCW